MYHILVINPGSTTTKVAVYADTQPIFSHSITHNLAELAPFTDIMAQLPYRRDLIIQLLRQQGFTAPFQAIIARGGLLKPIAGGVYAINAAMLHDTLTPMRWHACNLGAPLAHYFAQLHHCPAYIADPGVVDELAPEARLTGLPSMPRICVWHALNQRAIAHRFAHERGKRYEDCCLIGCHLGGGISVAVHAYGKAIEANNALDGEGPFSPERAGTLPTGQLLQQAFSGNYSYDQLRRSLAGGGGISAYLQTNDVRLVEQRMQQGDMQAKLVLDAMIYHTARYIGGAATVLKGRVEAIFLTGGVAHSDYVVARLTERIDFIAPVVVYPGENEMLSLATNALAVLQGECALQTYT